MHKGRQSKMDQNRREAEKALRQKAMVNHMLEGCETITAIKGVPTETLAVNVLDQFKGSGMPLSLLSENFREVVRQEAQQELFRSYRCS